jgi:tRNA(Ile)-lysidine synthetase-like protein
MSRLVDFWFANSRLWFSATEENDKFISEQFSSMIYMPIDWNSCTPIVCLEKIILYDQIVRHVFRNNKLVVNCFAQIALAFSRMLLPFDYLFSSAQKCFILMPLRHTFSLVHLEFVLTKIKQYLQQLPNDQHYLRFYKATILSLSKIKTPLISPEQINTQINDSDIFKSLDPRCSYFTQFALFESVEYNAVCKSLIYYAFENSLKKLWNDTGHCNITLSLSGGVDSMVSSYVLYQLRKKYKFDFIAVSINYNNREDNIYEMEFIKRWCLVLGIKHYIRHITELQRNRNYNRDLYEKITKTIRFDMYRRFGYPVILGHNADDCLENIINNIKKARSYDNLKGMKEFTHEEDCVLVRPMLNISKNDIRDFAFNCKIGHLPNSTPSWSERGKVREELLVFLNKFSPDIVPGLVALSEGVSEIYKINSDVMQNFYSRITFGSSVSIPCESEYSYGFNFWKDVFLFVCNTLSITPPSHKSIKYLIEKLNNKKYGNIQLSIGTIKYSPGILLFNKN